MLVLFLQYFVAAAVVVYAANKSGIYVDELDKKTNAGGAVLGGVLLAAVTSIPELITSLSSTILLNEPGYAFGNVFGIALLIPCLIVLIING